VDWLGKTPERRHIEKKRKFGVNEGGGGGTGAWRRQIRGFWRTVATALIKMKKKSGSEGTGESKVCGASDSTGNYSPEERVAWE